MRYPARTWVDSDIGRLLEGVRAVLAHKRLGAVRWLGSQLLERASIVAWAQLHTGDMLKVDLSNTIGRSVWLRGRYVSEIESQLRARLRPGDTFVDVGANVGYFSVVAARIVGPTGRVIAVEPVPAVATLLEASAARNGFAHLRVVRSALGRTPGRATMQVQTSSGISYLGDRRHRQAQDHIRCEVDVPVERLDDLLAKEGVPTPALVKIDVEGREPDVLAGAVKTLAAGTAFIVEFAPQHLRRFGATPEDLFAPFISAGYVAVDVHDGRPIGPGDTRRFLTDVLFIPRPVR